MSRLKKLMNDFKMLKGKVRLEKNPTIRNKLVAQLLLIRGQHKEHNLILIKKRKYAEDWRIKNRIKITNYNKMYARMKRERIRNERNT
jgi:hypothetical protein|tara:strand:- start:1354 stop:1617 length:264 start_codon:yes stop_codon:yes gene_type:complete